MRRKYRLLVNVASAIFYLGLPVYAEIPYDYHHASACHAYNGSSANQDLGYIANKNTNLLVEIVCPIFRIYPRAPHRLTKVDVDLSRYNPGNTAAYIYVCAKGYWHEGNAICVSKSAFRSGPQRITFTQDDLASIRTVTHSWAHYMYITVQQYPYDKLYGYVTYFDLN